MTTTTYHVPFEVRSHFRIAWQAIMEARRLRAEFKAAYGPDRWIAEYVSARGREKLAADVGKATLRTIRDRARAKGLTLRDVARAADGGAA